MKIFLNCIVHQNNEIVNDMIQNAKKFVRNPILVFHVNTCFADFDFERFSGIENVYINPERFSHGKYDSKMRAFTSNYNLLKGKGVEFDYQLLFYSQMLFVRSGIEDYIAGCDSCNHPLPAPENPFTWDELGLLTKGKSKCAAEGLVCTSAICEKLYSLISCTSLLEKEGWCLEEWIFPSLIEAFSETRKDVPMNHQRRKTHSTLEEVRGIVSGEITTLENFYTGVQSRESIFIMFRVDYDHNNPVRAFVRGLSA
jgi:hypothetical protein